MSKSLVERCKDKYKEIRKGSIELLKGVSARGSSDAITSGEDSAVVKKVDGCENNSQRGGAERTGNSIEGAFDILTFLNVRIVDVCLFTK